MPNGYVIHHINGDKLDNHIQNLQCVEKGLHNSFHHKGIRKSDEIKIKMNKSKNTTGYYRVTKHFRKDFKQGFIWQYAYSDDDGNYHRISRTDLNELKKVVEEKGLLWLKFN